MTNESAVRGRTRRPGAIDPKALTIDVVPNIADLWAWYVARSETTYADADPVNTVTDWSGNGRHMAQATGTRQPSYRTGIINGLPVFRFDGGDDLIANGTWAPGNIVTVGVVYKPNATNHVGLFDGGPNVAGIIRQYSGGNWEWHNNAPSCALSLPDTNAVFTLHQFYLIPQRRVDYYRNGAYINTFSSTSTSGTTWTTPRIGSINGGSAGFYAGDIAEFFIYSRQLDADEIGALNYYVQVVYALW